METFLKSSLPDRLYMCVELDQFSAQVILAYQPFYRKRHFVVVRQNTESHKSEVWACSPTALGLGVEPGQPVHTIKQRHRLLFVQKDGELEKTARADLSEVLEMFTPAFDIDERGRCVLDVSGIPLLKLLPPDQVAERLQQGIRMKTGLEAAAVGISHNRMVAGLLARMSVPAGTQICESGSEEAFLDSLDAELLPGLSPSCRDRLEKYGLKKIGQVRRLGRKAVIRRFGKEGEVLYGLALGLEMDRRVENADRVESETVLDRDINDYPRLVQNVELTADKFCHQLRSRNAQTRSLTFVLRYGDNRTTSKTILLAEPTNEFSALSRSAVKMFSDLYQRRVAAKALKLRTSRTRRDSGQLNLFESRDNSKKRKSGNAVAEIRARMGFERIVNASYAGAMAKSVDTGYKMQAGKRRFQDGERDRDGGRGGINEGLVIIE